MLDKDVLIALISGAATVAAAVLGGFAARSQGRPAPSSGGVYQSKTSGATTRRRWLITGAVAAACVGVIMGFWTIANFGSGGDGPDGVASSATPTPGPTPTTPTPTASRSTPAGPDVTGVQTAHVRSDVVGPGQAATATATCPAGMTVIGGGYWLRSPVGMVIDVSRPAAAGQGWQVHGFNPTGSNFDFDVDVVCGTVRDRQVVSQKATVHTGEKGIAIVPCPAGKISVGGGWSASGLAVDTSLPGSGLSNGWHVVAGNNTGDARTITAFAVCATAPSRSVASSSGTVDPNSRMEDGVECPAGKVSTGGGFVFKPTSGISLYISTKSSKQRWDVRADNRAGASRSLKAFAVCLTGG